MNSTPKHEPHGRAHSPESLTEQRARHRLFGVDVDIADQTETVREVTQWCRTGVGGVVVTPNLDHIVRSETNEPLSRAYERARPVLPDGRPLIWMARLTGGLRLSLVIGSDLVEPICAAAARVGYPIFLLDSRPEVLKTTAEILLRRHSGLRIAGFYAPPMGFDTSEEERRKALEAVRTARTDIVFVALGAPKRASGGPNPARAARTPGSDA